MSPIKTAHNNEPNKDSSLYTLPYKLNNTTNCTNDKKKDKMRKNAKKV